MYGFRTREALDLLRLVDPDHPNQDSDQAKAHPATPVPADANVPADIDEYRPSHINAKDAIAFAAMKMKQYYDTNHQPKFFQEGDLVNL